MRPVSFVRVEGALVRRSPAFAAAWLGANAQHLRHRAWQVGAALLSTPVSLRDPELATRMAYMGLMGTSEDRLRILGEELAEGWLLPQIDALGEDVIGRAKAEGRAVVLVTGHLDVVAAPLVKRLKADALVANRMELRDGKATGRLLDPLVGAPSGQWLRAYASEHGYDLTLAQAYGATGEDAVLLSAVARPCAVRPDASLRRLARQHDWPVMEA